MTKDRLTYFADALYIARDLTDHERGELGDFLSGLAAPPYESLGDSGQIHCPVCNGDGKVYPPDQS